MLKKSINFKGIILAFELGFIFCFFLGIFWNHPNLENGSPLRVEVYNDKSWFYINRGLPIPWAGVSLINKAVDFPFIKAPFITRNGSFIDQNQYNKVIDLKTFLPLFITSFLIFYFFTFIFGKASDENKNLNRLLIPAYLVLFLGCIFVYFFWFPRI